MLWLCWILFLCSRLVSSINVTNTRYRENYHIQPEAGWMNDPNGLIYFNNQYHVFYQYDPDFRSPIQWGHVVSPDLVHWKYLPTALFPDQVYDKSGVWTGSAVDDNGVLSVLYAGNVNNDTYGGFQIVNLATSTDGVTFTKYSGNPVVNAWPYDGTGQFRDPKVWKYNGLWYMVVGTQDYRGLGRVAFYTSMDLRNWTYIGVPAGASDSRYGGMWECPNFFELDGKFVLLVGTGLERDGDRFVNNAINSYLIGDYNYTTNIFTHGDMYESNFGHNMYAAQTFVDPKNRTILFGWMWGAIYPEEADNWAGVQTLPMQLSLNTDKTRVQMYPVEEMALLRANLIIDKLITVEGTYDTGISTDCTEVWINFSLANTSARKTGLSFPVNGGQVKVYYDKLTGKVVVDRNKEIRQAYLGSITQVNLRIFFDKSTIEVFVNEGAATFSSRYYADNVPKFTLIAEYGVANVNLQAYQLSNIWQ